MISKNLHETDSLLLTVVFHARLLAVVRNKAVVEHLLVESETDVILQHQDRAWKCVLARRTSRLPEVGTEVFEARKEDLFDIGTRLSFADSKLRWARRWSLTAAINSKLDSFQY